MYENEKENRIVINIADGTSRIEERYPRSLWESLQNPSAKEWENTALGSRFKLYSIGAPLLEDADPNIPDIPRDLKIKNVLPAEKLLSSPGDVFCVFGPPGIGKTQWVLDTILPMDGTVIYITHRLAAEWQMKKRILQAADALPNAENCNPEILDLLFTPESSHIVPETDVVVAVYQKVIPRVKKKKPLANNKPIVIIVDELHALWADAGFNNKTDKVLEYIFTQYPKAIKVVMTATPQVALGNFVSWLSSHNYSGQVHCYNFVKKPDTDSIAHFLHTQQEIVQTISDSDKEQKYLVFVEAIKQGKELECALQMSLGSESVAFLDAENMRNGNQEELVSCIINKATFDKKVLIVTPVLDAAVSLIDKSLRNLIFYSVDPVRVEQEYGRKRRQPKEKTHVYFVIPDTNDLQAKKYHLQKQLREAKKYITLIKSGVTVDPENLPYPFYIEWGEKENQSLHSTRQQLDVKWNPFTLNQWAWEIRQYDEAIRALNENGDAGYAEMLLQKLNIADRSWLNNEYLKPEDDVAQFYNEALNYLKDKENRTLCGDEANDFLNWVADMIQKIPDTAYEKVNKTKGNSGDGRSVQGFKKLMMVLGLEFHVIHNTKKQNDQESWRVVQGKGGK